MLRTMSLQSSPHLFFNASVNIIAGCFEIGAGISLIGLSAVIRAATKILSCYCHNSNEVFSRASHSLIKEGSEKISSPLIKPVFGY